MKPQRLLEILDALGRNVDPLTGELLTCANPLDRPEVRPRFHHLLQALSGGAAGEGDTDLRDAVQATHRSLLSLGYRPTKEQLVRILYGSRTIADDRLRGLPHFKTFRDRMNKRALRAALAKIDLPAPAAAETVPQPAVKKTAAPWKTVDFFRTDPYDHFTEDRQADIRRALRELPLFRQADQLPAYMARARERYPRAYEPWSKQEKGLLLEAMCYTNDLDKLAAILQRSRKSVEAAGQQLIYNSRRDKAA